MAAADEPIRIDPEILNAHHAGTLTQLIGARFVEATKDRLVAELTVRDDLTTVGGRVHGGTLMTLADLVGATGTFLDRKSTRLNSSHIQKSRMPSSA